AVVRDHGGAVGMQHSFPPELLAVIGGDGKPALAGRNGGHVSNAPLGPQALRLPLARLNELGARDTVGETVMVLDPRPAGLSLVIVDNQRLESRLREKDGRAAAGAAAAYHDDVTHEIGRASCRERV